MTAGATNGSTSPLSGPSTGEQKPGKMPEKRDRSDSQAQANGKGSGTTAPKSTSAANAKDPHRPRRKKAKRACFACQRAHLTCGDERPCQRCIKRGLQDACHDGVRKKAKYLHDTPNEALMPGIRGNAYTQSTRNMGLSRNNAATNKSQQPQHQHQENAPNFYPAQQQQQQQPSTYNVYSPAKSQGQMGPPLLQDNTMNPGVFQSQSPMSPTFNMADPNAQHQSLTPTLPHASATPTPTTANPSQNPFGSAFFDPSDPALFNFDIASMNFGNHYGALEFGMLNHMATGAGETPPSDTATQRGSMTRSGSGTFIPPGTAGSNLGGSPSQSTYLFNEPVLNEWASNSNIYNQNMIAGHIPEAPHAFAIESGPNHFPSPNSAGSPQMPNTTMAFEDANNSQAYASRPNLAPQSLQQRQPRISTANIRHLQVGGKRRRRDPSAIYDSVKEPYSYTNGFHTLTAFIQRRFTPQKTLRIAKSLASIRPSFIATTKTLNQDDLVFMEKCFQRTLWEYEDFINACGTPTIVCRRTGEIAAVGKEFSILTGWKKEVLLGKEPNLNVNTGCSSTASSSRSGFAPRIPAVENVSGQGRTQPVFIAELLDDDGVIEFYEDFSKLAFGDSRGSVMTTCKLLKYKTKEDTEQVKVEGDNNSSSSNGNAESGANNTNGTTTANGMHQPQQGGDQKRKWDKGGIAGEAGMNQLGFRDGKVECSYCWTVKRDVFDIPMLIVMNFLPCI
ncbi:hypothetical protein AJ80_06703 [Polytolypa hystricis UAMH7299]|uniref:Zn(2)-C6 fungal-type domain-containing protein n=1 Tax=Polytolypa hystricis (strain UAMH7299) TaxID=1447883 RepID=A0A2B7XV89_POLH7|nr:hypothetical protein AJ80_06703 [Polytolypa hystricis UAMH7299]